MTNKIVAKFSAPYLIGGALFLSTVVGTTILKNKENQFIAEMQMNHANIPENTIGDTLYLLIITIGLLAVYFGFVVMPGKARDKANVLTKKYIDEQMEKHPELKKYTSVLSNEKALTALAALACNSLNKQERDKIIELARNTNKIDAKSKAELEEKILNIVRTYAAQHPEYLQTIEKFLKSKDLQETYVINSVQNVL